MPARNASPWRAGSRRRKPMLCACAARAAIFFPPCPWTRLRSVGRLRSTAMSGAHCRGASSQSGNSTLLFRPHQLSGRVYLSLTHSHRRLRPAIWPNKPEAMEPVNTILAERTRAVHNGIGQFGRTNPSRCSQCTPIQRSEPTPRRCSRRRSFSLNAPSGAPRSRQLAKRTRDGAVGTLDLGRTNPRDAHAGRARRRSHC